MDKIDCMQTFTRVVELGSFTAVAETSGKSQSAISKQVKWLENTLGVILVHRTTRKLHITDAGLDYYNNIKPLLDNIKLVESSIQPRKQTSGSISLSSPLSIGVVKLNDIYADFASRFKDIKLNIQYSDSFVNLVESGVDVAIRIGIPVEDGMVYKKLGTMQRCCVASPQYLARQGKPLSPINLEQHQCIHYSRLRSGTLWQFRNTTNNALEEVHIKPAISVDSSLAQITFAKKHLGICIGPTWLFTEALKHNELMHVFDNYVPTEFVICAVFPTRKHRPQKIRLFLEFLEHSLRSPLGV